MKKIMGWFTSDVLGSVTGLIDELFTSKEEKLKAKALIQEAFMKHSLELEQMKADIIIAEAKGNWLQRSWRPILMLGFGFVVLYSKFIAPAFNLPNAELEADFWDLLRIGIGGYVIGRSAEKIVTDIAPRINIKSKTKDHE